MRVLIRLTAPYHVFVPRFGALVLTMQATNTTRPSILKPTQQVLFLYF